MKQFQDFEIRSFLNLRSKWTEFRITMILQGELTIYVDGNFRSSFSNSFLKPLINWFSHSVDDWRQSSTSSSAFSFAFPVACRNTCRQTSPNNGTIDGKRKGQRQRHGNHGGELRSDAFRAVDREVARCDGSENFRLGQIRDLSSHFSVPIRCRSRQK